MFSRQLFIFITWYIYLYVLGGIYIYTYIYREKFNNSKKNISTTASTHLLIRFYYIFSLALRKCMCTYWLAGWLSVKTSVYLCVCLSCNTSHPNQQQQSKKKTKQIFRCCHLLKNYYYYDCFYFVVNLIFLKTI